MSPAALLAVALATAGTAAPGAIHVAVPIVRQAPERCGPAALAMVLRFHGAPPAALGEAERAYDPVLKGSLITDLAAAARRAGFAASVERPSEDSLLALLAGGLPPILLYRRGLGVVSVGHYGVVVGWDPEQRRYIVHDGGPRPRRLAHDDLMNRWRAAGSLALVVRPAGP